MEPDFDKLNKNLPNRNWREVWERLQRGEKIPYAMRIAIERYTPKDNPPKN